MARERRSARDTPFAARSRSRVLSYGRRAQQADVGRSRNGEQAQGDASTTKAEDTIDGNDRSSRRGRPHVLNGNGRRTTGIGGDDEQGETTNDQRIDSVDKSLYLGGETITHGKTTATSANRFRSRLRLRLLVSSSITVLALAAPSPDPPSRFLPFRVDASLRVSCAYRDDACASCASSATDSTSLWPETATRTTNDPYACVPCPTTNDETIQTASERTCDAAVTVSEQRCDATVTDQKCDPAATVSEQKCDATVTDQKCDPAATVSEQKCDATVTASDQKYDATVTDQKCDVAATASDQKYDVAAKMIDDADVDHADSCFSVAAATNIADDDDVDTPAIVVALEDSDFSVVVAAATDFDCVDEDATTRTAAAFSIVDRRDVALDAESAKRTSTSVVDVDRDDDDSAATSTIATTIEIEIDRSVVDRSCDRSRRFSRLRRWPLPPLGPPSPR